MRIVTRPDFDGIVCAVLLYEAEQITGPVKWVEPNDMQKGLIKIQPSDIVANLPYSENCALWFDHHYSNRIDKPFNGAFRVAPSAAGIIFNHYKDAFRDDYHELVKETDKIDSANLSKDEVLHPENYPYLLLSMTVSNIDVEDELYWNKMVDLLRRQKITEVLEDPEVKNRCNRVILENKRYKVYLEKYTTLKKHVAITDFRPLGKDPEGNRFLVYSLFPECVVEVKIRFTDEKKNKIAVSVGHSIFNRKCNVNVGKMLAGFEGGGHSGAGSCRFHVSRSEAYINGIIDILLKNEAIDDKEEA
ncbi:exopolyphosphatase [Thermodesulfobacteriota bacterium]